MAINVFPSSKDIYIEVNGRRLAVAQNYKAKTTKESRYVQAFGSAEPVGTIGGRIKHIVELTRVYIINSALHDGIDFYNLDNFNVVIVKPDRRIIFSGCEWASIGENAGIDDVMLETVSIVATKRMEVM